MYRFFLLLFLLSLTVTAKDERVFVRNFSSTSIDSAQGASLANLFASELKHFTTWDIITYSDVASMIEQELDKELLDCNDESCMQEIAGALGAPLMVRGDITKVGSYYIINVSLLHTTQGKSIRKVSERSKTIDGLIELFSLVAQRLAGKEQHATLTDGDDQLTSQSATYSFNQTKRYIVRFESNPPGAVVMVDGDLVTASSPGQKSLSAGTHRVKMSRELYHNWEGSFTVSENGQVVLGTLKPSFGYLSVRANLEGVPITVDDSLVGLTPLLYHVLSEGSHTISVGNGCHLNQSGTIAIESDSTKELSLTIVERMAALTISATDSATGIDMIAEVYLDGNLVGTTPFSEAIPLCTEKLIVREKNHGDYKKNLSLREGEVSTYSVILGNKPKKRSSPYKYYSNTTHNDETRSTIAKLFFDAQLGLGIGWIGKFGNRYDGQGVEIQFQMPIYRSAMWYMGYSRTFNNSYSDFAKQQIIDDYSLYNSTPAPTLEEITIEGTTREFTFGGGIPLLMAYVGVFWEDFTPNYTFYGTNDEDIPEVGLGFSVGVRSSVPLGRKLTLSGTAGYGWESEFDTKYFSVSAVLSYLMGPLW